MTSIPLTIGASAESMYKLPPDCEFPPAFKDPSLLQRRPLIWGYGRASDKDQHNSPSTQQAYVKALASTLSGTWGGFVCDYDVSGLTVPFAKRPAGRLLLENLATGDHVIVHRLDRLARNMADTPKVMAWFEQNEINLYICDFSGQRVDLNRAIIKLMVNVMGSVAQFYSELLGERTREGMRASKMKGLPHGAHRLGMHRVPNSGGGRKWLYVADYAAQRERDQIRQWHARYFRNRDTMALLAKEAVSRKLCDSDGRAWAHYDGRGKIHVQRIRTSILFYERMLRERGAEVWDDFSISPDPMAGKRNRRRLASGIFPSVPGASLRVPPESLAGE